MNSSACPPRVGLRGIAYHVDEIALIDQIPILAGDPALLAAFKASGHACFARSNTDLAAQAIAAARKTLAAAHMPADAIDAVVIGTSEMPGMKRIPEMLSTEILAGLGMRGIPVVGVTLAGCANYSSALRVARNMIVAEGLRNVLVIETDQVRGAMQRPYVSRFTGAACAIFGDGAASFIVCGGDSMKDADFELAGMAQIVSPIDTERVELNDIWINTVTGFRRVVDEAMRRAGTAPDELAEIVVSNVGPELNAGLLAALGFPPFLVDSANAARTAHVWSCDNLINLADRCAAQAVPAGALFLLLCNAESYFSAIVCRRQ
jgi:3-oxoacyl-[acyl-carrier-protein] synthase III